MGAFEIKTEEKMPGPGRLGRYRYYHLLFISQRQAEPVTAPSGLVTAPSRAGSRHVPQDWPDVREAGGG